MINFDGEEYSIVKLYKHIFKYFFPPKKLCIKVNGCFSGALQVIGSYRLVKFHLHLSKLQFTQYALFLKRISGGSSQE